MTTCAHCAGEQVGDAMLVLGSTEYPLCHPDEGLDCYRLVSVWHHDMPCSECRVDTGGLDARTTLTVVEEVATIEGSTLRVELDADSDAWSKLTEDERSAIVQRATRKALQMLNMRKTSDAEGGQES